MVTLTITAQTGGMNVGTLQINESIRVGTASESVVVLSNLVSLPPQTDSEILLIHDPIKGSMVYASDSDVLLVFNGMNWKRADGQNDSYLIVNIPCVPFADSRDGTSYNTVKIGTQCWMAENLKYLPSVVGPGTDSETDPNYYVYSYDGIVVAEAKATANYATYGVLYNWPAAMDGSASSNNNPSGVQGICPEGWHLPSSAEWTTLTTYLGGESVAGGKMKEMGTSHWLIPNTNATNESGFTALPGGYRFNDGAFYEINSGCDWWSATESFSNSVWDRGLEYDNASVYSYSSNKSDGFSVRCTRDN